MIRRKIDGVRWEIRPGFDALLAEVLADRGRIIKESPAKLVTVHQISGKTFYVKKYRNVSVLLRSLKFYFKPSHARREWRLAHRIERLGIPIVQHLAIGERWKRGGLIESILVTEGFDGEPLDKFAGRLSDPVQGALGQLVRQMHDCGVLQFDLHPNILVCAAPLALRRVDVHHAAIKPSLRETEKLDNLAFLNIAVPLGEKFYDAYGSSSDLAARVRRRSEAMRREYLAIRARRCFKRNAEFTREKIGSLDWWLRIPLATPEARRILADPDDFLQKTARLLKAGRSTTVGSGHGLVVKRFNLRKAVRVLKDLLRVSRSRQAYLKAYHLELVGIPSARPIAAADHRRLRFLMRSYFIMEEIHGAVEAGAWPGDMRQAARATGRLIGALHEGGFRHRDLKETNLVFDHQARPHLIDLEGLKFVGTVSPARAVADLRRLNRAAIEKLPRATAADRRSFLRAYCQTRRLRPRQLFRRGT